MAEELQQNMQMKLCQASDETLRAIAEEFNETEYNRVCDFPVYR